jgi:hypothetical protein
VSLRMFIDPLLNQNLLGLPEIRSGVRVNALISAQIFGQIYFVGERIRLTVRAEPVLVVDFEDTTIVVPADPRLAVDVEDTSILIPRVRSW